MSKGLIYLARFIVGWSLLIALASAIAGDWSEVLTRLSMAVWAFLAQWDR